MMIITQLGVGKKVKSLMNFLSPLSSIMLGNTDACSLFFGSQHCLNHSPATLRNKLDKPS